MMNRNNHPVKNSLNFRHPSGGWEFPAFGTMSGLSSSIAYSVGSYKRSGFVKLNAQCIKKIFVHFVFNK